LHSALQLIETKAKLARFMVEMELEVVVAGFCWGQVEQHCFSDIHYLKIWPCGLFPGVLVQF